jgi:hypothetical protein
MSEFHALLRFLWRRLSPPVPRAYDTVACSPVQSTFVRPSSATKKKPSGNPMASASDNGPFDTPNELLAISCSSQNAPFWRVQLPLPFHPSSTWSDGVPKNLILQRFARAKPTFGIEMVFGMCLGPDLWWGIAGSSWRAVAVSFAIDGVPT